MSLDEVISREKVLECIIELQEKRDKYISSTDSLGHQIWMLTNYTQAYLIDKFEFDPYEIEKYKNKEKNQLELDL